MRLTSTALVGLTLLAANTSLAQVDFVFLDIGPDGQRVEPGALDISGFAHNTNGQNNSYVGLVSQTGDVFDLSIANNNPAGASSGGIDWRDRGDSTSVGSLVHLGEDFIKNNAGFIELTLSGLPAGEYTATSYHIDSVNSQSDDIHVFITDALGTDVDAGQVGDAGTNLGNNVNNINTGVVSASSIMDFTFVSDGLSDVILAFDGNTNSSDNETPLNGLFLRFTAVPEPASIAIWSMIGLGLFGFGYRCYRQTKN